ncbi:phage portal protein [Paracoccus sp. MA]|uniref:phage portal protein n=1 Tax=Paracoccus sp. MA TaxID=2895796 RepID=UPI001E5FA260|nr:phage portal protein [Paracoccus sp. MA]UFM66792.1 phage portal protein [Paracoccus sp. MA]
MGVFDFLRKKKPAKSRRAGRGLSRRYLRAPTIPGTEGGWNPIGGMERAFGDLPKVRARARDNAMNTPYGVRAVRTLTDHSVGSGIRYRVAGDPEYRAALNAWAGSSDCDHRGTQTLYDLQATAAETLFSGGDVLWVFRHVENPETGRLELTIQIIDPEQIDTWAPARHPGNEVQQGVEVDPDGRVVGYHVRASMDSTLPGNWETEFIPASRCILMLERRYPDQIRGIPRGAAALERLHQGDSLFVSELARARTQAAFGVFLRVPESEDGAKGLLGEIDPNEDSDDAVPEVLVPGSVTVLPPGYEPTMATPSQSGGFTDHIRKTIEAVAVGYGVLYYHISGDVTGFNYSSGKLGETDFRRSIDSLRAHTIYPVLLRIEREFRDVYEINEMRDVDVAVRMVPPARESMEPAKEIAAELSELAAGLLPLEEAWLRRGYDPDDMWAALKEQGQKLAELSASGMPLKFGSLDLTATLIAAQNAEDDSGASLPGNPEPD